MSDLKDTPVDQVEAVARRMARRAHGPICDLDTIVEFGEPWVIERTPRGTVYGPRPFSACLWMLYSDLARAALEDGTAA